MLPLDVHVQVTTTIYNTSLPINPQVMCLFDMLYHDMSQTLPKYDDVLMIYSIYLLFPCYSILCYAMLCPLLLLSMPVSHQGRDERE